MYVEKGRASREVEFPIQKQANRITEYRQPLQEMGGRRGGDVKRLMCSGVDMTCEQRRLFSHSLCLLPLRNNAFEPRPIITRDSIMESYRWSGNSNNDLGDNTRWLLCREEGCLCIPRTSHVNLWRRTKRLLIDRVLNY